MKEEEKVKMASQDEDEMRILRAVSSSGQASFQSGLGLRFAGETNREQEEGQFLIKMN